MGKQHRQRSAPKVNNNRRRIYSKTPIESSKDVPPLNFFQKPKRSKSFHSRAIKSVSNEDRNHLQIHHVTDHDSSGLNQYDLLLCTLKYSLLCTAKELYDTDSLNLDESKFDKLKMSG